VSLPALRYLSAADVTAALPPLDERLRLAERTLVALADGSGELPAKIGVHPRPTSSFGHAMPAYLRGADADGEDDLLGMKWVVGFPANGERDLPTIFATVVMNDAASGLPLAILDGGPITAARTAAISGAAIRRFGPEPGAGSGRGHRVGLIGAGVQGRSHVEIVGHVLPGAILSVYGPRPAQVEALVAIARSTPGIADAVVASEPREATIGADVVISAASFGPLTQVMTEDWLTPHALVVPVDYATYCSAAVAANAGLFLVDEMGQFLANREAGLFAGYPDPAGTLGAAIIAGTGRPVSGRVVATHLGTGLADLVFGRAIVRRATEAGLGTVIPR
jgi:ornithine cyclodeaminase/alanine dehydrogenase-like protein (mu-crystallin family)